MSNSLIPLVLKENKKKSARLHLIWYSKDHPFAQRDYYPSLSSDPWWKVIKKDTSLMYIANKIGTQYSTIS